MKILLEVTLGNKDTDCMDNVNVLVEHGNDMIETAIKKAEQNKGGFATRVKILGYAEIE